MQREQVQKLALEAGFKLKKQPSGEMDLNPYVYTFVEKLFEESEEINLLRNLHIMVRGVHRYNGVDPARYDEYVTGMQDAMALINDFHHRCEYF